MEFQLILVSAAILIAVLSLWAQLWHKSAYDQDQGRQISATLGILWIYIAIFFSMMSIALFLISEYFVPINISKEIIFNKSPKIFVVDLSFSFLITSFIMGFANIAESAFSVFRKAISGKTAFYSMLGTRMVKNSANFIRLFAIVIVIAAFLILVVSILGKILSNYYFLGYLPILIFLVWINFLSTNK